MSGSTTRSVKSIRCASGAFQFLRVLEIPASLLSVSNMSSLPSNAEKLQQLKSLDEMAFYVSWPDKAQLKQALTRVVPRCLRRLWLCDWTNRFPYDWPKELAELRLSFEVRDATGLVLAVQFRLQIVFLPRHSVQMRLPWMKSSTPFMLQAFWAPPYFPIQDNQGQQLTNDQITAQVSERTRSRETNTCFSTETGST